MRVKREVFVDDIGVRYIRARRSAETPPWGDLPASDASRRTTPLRDRWSKKTVGLPCSFLLLYRSLQISHINMGKWEASQGQVVSYCSQAQHFPHP